MTPSVVNGPFPASCLFAGRSPNEPTVTFVVNGGASAGYRADSVGRRTE
jgi:hypothetical protein